MRNPQTRQRWQIRTTLLIVILLTTPCYCVGGTLLIIAPGLRQTPTGVSIVTTNSSTKSDPKTGRPKSSATPKQTLVPSLTLPELPATPIDVQFATATNSSVVVISTTVFSNPTVESGLPICSEFGGGLASMIRTDAPGAAGGANVYCKPITDNNQIGVADVINRGVRVAVDIFAMNGSAQVTRFSRSARVCLLGSGIFLFLDANNSPRSAAQLPASSESGYTCARIPNAGMVVLVER